jgi:hypothetical protein
MTLLSSDILQRIYVSMKTPAIVFIFGHAILLRLGGAYTCRFLLADAHHCAQCSPILFPPCVAAFPGRQRLHFRTGVLNSICRTWWSLVRFEQTQNTKTWLSLHIPRRVHVANVRLCCISMCGTQNVDTNKQMQLLDQSAPRIIALWDQVLGPS